MQALDHFIQDTGSKPDGLFTAYSLAHNRVTMHGVRMELIERQAYALGIQLYTLGLPDSISDEIYEELLLNKLEELKIEGYSKVVFGDIYLEDLREYRIRQLEKVGMDYEFPLWKRATKDLIRQFVAREYKGIVVSVNGTMLGKEQAGLTIDNHFVTSLPQSVDPCGENGEFHTFVYDGPHFSVPVSFVKGETIKRTYPSPVDESEVVYWFTDLVP